MILLNPNKLAKLNIFNAEVMKNTNETVGIDEPTIIVRATIGSKEVEFIPAFTDYSMEQPKKKETLLKNADADKRMDVIFHFATPDVFWNEEVALFDRNGNAIAKNTPNIRIGLNNIGHVLFAKEHPEYEYFADIYLYLSNRAAAELLYSECPNFIGGYLWIERKTYIEPWPITPTTINGFQPPLFISRACYRHDGLGLDCKGCGRHHLFTLEQNGDYYEAIVDNCQTIIRKKK